MNHHLSGFCVVKLMSSLHVRPSTHAPASVVTLAEHSPETMSAFSASRLGYQNHITASGNLLPRQDQIPTFATCGYISADPSQPAVCPHSGSTSYGCRKDPTAGGFFCQSYSGSSYISTTGNLEATTCVSNDATSESDTGWFVNNLTKTWYGSNSYFQ